MAAAPLAHGRQHGAGDGVQAEHVGVEQGTHFVRAGFLHRAQQAVAGVVDEDIDAPEALQRLFRRCPRLGRVAHVQLQRQQLRVLAQRGDDSARIACGGHHGIAPGQRLARNQHSETARGARDEPDFICVRHDHFLCVRIRARRRVRKWAARAAGWQEAV